MNAQALLQKNVQLEGQVQTLETEKSNLETKLLNANTQLEWLKRQLFGKRSEKIINKEDQDQLSFEGFKIEETSKEKEAPVKGHTRKKRTKGKNTITLPDDLPIEKEIQDIPEEEKICPDTKKPLEKIGEEISSKLAYKPGSYYIKQIIRPKYATPKGTIQTAPFLKVCSTDVEQMKAFSPTSSLANTVIISPYIDKAKS